MVHRSLVHYLHVHEDKQMRGLRPDSEYVEPAVEVSAMLADASPRHDHYPDAYHRHTL
ncbi:hypothetical protein [Curtobacterium sp. RIT-PI-V]|uniref:hypothetical protein n=1 Tax=Curtobacterium sp. RIT-PI-V TaxID=3035296 RepID=UPI0021DADD3A|nr:hypothetical protein [Curtobacterium sp. RIT-PI-V]